MGHPVNAFHRENAASEERSLSARFHDFFHVDIADTKAKRTEAYQLRYQVYCQERGFEDAQQFAERIERDAFDEQSLQAMVRHNESGIPVGVVRLITTHSGEANLPIEEACGDSFDLPTDHIFNPPRQHAAEVSRFAISKTAVQAISMQSNPGDSGHVDVSEQKLKCQCISQGLISALFHMSKIQRVNFWYALMEPALSRHLSRLGLDFIKIGPLVNHHGRRQPMLAKLETLLSQISKRNPELFQLIQDIDSAHTFTFTDFTRKRFVPESISQEMLLATPA